MDTKPYKRRTIVIKKGLQFKTASILVALFSLASFMVWWETYSSLTDLARSGLIQDPEIVFTLKQISHVLLLKISVALALVTLLSILLSHFVAGPVYRLEKSLDVLRQGDLTHRIFLRKHDELGQVAQAFNQATESLQYKVASLQNANEKMAAELEEIARRTNGPSAEEIKALARQIKAPAKEFKI